MFALVIRYNTLCIILVKAAIKDLKVDYININTIFLNPIILEEIFIAPTKLLKRVFLELKHKDVYIQLNKALYGLKQSPREWFLIVKEVFKRFSLQLVYSNLNLFIRNRVFLLLFINNIIVIRKRQDINKIKAYILKEQNSKDLGPIECFIGFEIIRDRKNYSLIISQS